MTQYNPSAALLPNGLLDLLSPQAESEARAISSFMQTFAAFGYNRVKPPLVEFEESLLGAGPGKALSRQTFRLMDPVSQRMMGVRADVTAQIARIATSRLSETKRPLRLSYAADVLRVNGTQLRPERQFCQVGCEMIGTDTVMADVETMLIALKALSSLSIANLSIDLTVPTLVQNLYEDLGIGEDDAFSLDEIVEQRNRDAVLASGSPAASMIVALMELEGAAEKSLPKLKALGLKGKAAEDMKRLSDAAEGLASALKVYGLSDIIQITIAPLERRGFEYQTGVSFTLFASGARGELGRGGRYDVAVSGKAPETATGFTLYMDSILRVAPAFKAPEQKNVSADADWETVKALQEQGIQVIRT